MNEEERTKERKGFFPEQIQFYFKMENKNLSFAAEKKSISIVKNFFESKRHYNSRHVFKSCFYFTYFHKKLLSLSFSLSFFLSLSLSRSLSLFFLFLFPFSPFLSFSASLHCYFTLFLFSYLKFCSLPPTLFFAFILFF